MKKIEKKIREYFGESIWSYLGGEEIKIVKRLPGRITKVKVLNMPNSDSMKKISQYMGELIIFKEMNDDEKNEIICKEFNYVNKSIELDMKKMENRRRKRKRRKLRKRDSTLAEGGEDKLDFHRLKPDNLSTGNFLTGI